LGIVILLVLGLVTKVILDWAKVILGWAKVILGYDKRHQDREGRREILDFDSQWPPLEQH
jgi:hypothetical protein